MRAEDGGFADLDDSRKFRFTTGVYSNVWETRASSLKIEVLVDDSVKYTPVFPVNQDNPRAWITVSAQGRTLGVIEFELKADWCPLAAENFYKLCEAGVFKGSYLHRIIPNCMIQGGDYNIRSTDTVPEEELFDLSLVEYRRGGRSIFEEVTFPDEDLSIKHAGMGVLSMASERPGVNASQFFVTLADGPLRHLDGRYQVFGQVVSGMQVLKAVEPLGTEQGTVLQRVVLEDCGVGSAPGAAAADPAERAQRGPSPQPAEATRRRSSAREGRGVSRRAAPPLRPIVPLPRGRLGPGQGAPLMASATLPRGAFCAF